MNDSAGALVVAAYGRRMLLELPDGRLRHAMARNRRLRAVCGDTVETAGDDDTVVVTAIRPRSTVLWRYDARTGRRPLAANLDTLVIVAAPAPPVTPEQLDRYLAIAELLELDALLVGNKTDLGPAATGEYAALGYPVYPVSAHSGTGLDRLAAALAHRTGALTGLSGVGKSALITALVPDFQARSAALSATSGEGRHTTTAAHLYHLPDGGNLIDSPGVRDIRLWPMPPQELAHGYIEFRPHLSRCRFRDCRHRQEPGCAVRAAVGRGEIGERRYRSYLALAERLEGTRPA